MVLAICSNCKKQVKDSFHKTSITKGWCECKERIKDDFTRLSEEELPTPKLVIQTEKFSWLSFWITVGIVCLTLLILVVFV